MKPFQLNMNLNFLLLFIDIWLLCVFNHLWPSSRDLVLRIVCSRNFCAVIYRDKNEWKAYVQRLTIRAQISPNETKAMLFHPTHTSMASNEWTKSAHIIFCSVWRLDYCFGVSCTFGPICEFLISPSHSAEREKKLLSWNAHASSEN